MVLVIAVAATTAVRPPGRRDGQHRAPQSGGGQTSEWQEAKGSFPDVIGGFKTSRRPGRGGKYFPSEPGRGRQMPFSS